jgi:Flp pilus assembly protein TadB
MVVLAASEVSSAAGHLSAAAELNSVKLAGFLLLLSGWLIVLAAVVLFVSAPLRAVFVFSGAAVEVLGLALVVRSHRAPRATKE